MGKIGRKAGAQKVAKASPSRSPLVLRPRHLEAIGLLSVEIARLEQANAQLFGAILGVHFVVAETLYFTPRAAMARLDAISNIAPITLHTFKNEMNKVNRFVERSKAALGKRNSIIHGYWVLSHSHADVDRFDLPMLAPPKPLTLAQLHNLIVGVQTLTGEIEAFAYAFSEKYPPFSETVQEYWKR